MPATKYEIVRSLNAGSKRYASGEVVPESAIPKQSRAWLKRGGYIVPLEDRSDD